MLLAADLLERVAQFFEVDAGRVLRDLIEVALIWGLTWVAVRVLRMVGRRIRQAVDDGDPTRLSPGEQRGNAVSQLLYNVGTTALVVMAILLSLNVFINIGPLLAGAGIIGLAFSFGAQSLVKDLIAGFFMVAEAQFAIGDIIEVAGKAGMVERMTLRVVMLRDEAGTLHIIPNGAITTVSNMTRTWSRAVVDVEVAYQADVDGAIRVIRDEAEGFARAPAWGGKLQGAPEVPGVISIGDGGVTIRALIRTVPGAQWEVGREFRRRVKNRLDQEAIPIPYPQRMVRVRLEEEGGRRPPAPRPDGA